MSSDHRILRKSYAMHRMALAIGRAVDAPSVKEQERAARWAAAWGLLCGIKTAAVRLRRSEIDETSDGASLPWDEQIHISIGPGPAQKDTAPDRGPSPGVSSAEGSHPPGDPAQQSAP